MKLHRIQAMNLKYFYITKNRVDRVFDLFYWPVVNLFIWGFMTLYIQKLSDFNVQSMILGGVIFWIFVWRSTQDMGVFVLEEFWNRDLYHLYSSPIKPSEHMMAVIITGLVRASISFVILFVVALLLYSFNIFTFGIYLPFFVFMLTLIGWVLGLFIVAMIFRWGHRIQVLAWSIPFGIQPFSCVFYPLAALPAWAYPIAVVLPTTHVFEAMRAVLRGELVAWNLILYAVLATLVFLIIGAFVLSRAIRHARKTGLLAKAD